MRRVIAIHVTEEEGTRRVSLLEQAAATAMAPRAPGTWWRRAEWERSPTAIAIRCSGVVGWQRVVGTPTQIGRTTACGGVHIKIGHPSLLPSPHPCYPPSCPTIDRSRDLVYYPRAVVTRYSCQKTRQPFPDVCCKRYSWLKVWCLDSPHF